MARPRKFSDSARTVERVRQAIERERGFITRAADALGVKYDTLKRYVDAHVELQEEIAHHREHRIDFAEFKLDKALEAEAPWAIALVLKGAKSRDYGNRLTLEGDESRPLQVRTFDYGSSVAKITTGSESDRNGSGDDKGRHNGTTLGEDAPRGSDESRMRE